MRVAVYTVIIPHTYGSKTSECVLKPPQIINQEVDHWLISDTQVGIYPWNDYVITRTPGLSSRREIQTYKLQSHKWLPEYTHVIYQDGNVQLRMDPFDIVRMMQETGKKVFFGRHPWRNCSYEEGLECAPFKSNNEEIINAQLARYAKAGFPHNFGLIASTFFVRDNRDPKVCEFFDLWYEETMNGSHRNQVSFGFSAWKSGLDYYGSGIRWGDNPIWGWNRL